MVKILVPIAPWDLPIVDLSPNKIGDIETQYMGFEAKLAWTQCSFAII